MKVEGRRQISHRVTEKVEKIEEVQKGRKEYVRYKYKKGRR